MKLDDYLKGIRGCPDEKLTDEFGVYDNWITLLNGDVKNPRTKVWGVYGLLITRKSFRFSVPQISFERFACTSKIKFAHPRTQVGGLRKFNFPSFNEFVRALVRSEKWIVKPHPIYDLLIDVGRVNFDSVILLFKPEPLAIHIKKRRIYYRNINPQETNLHLEYQKRKYNIDTSLHCSFPGPDRTLFTVPYRRSLVFGIEDIVRNAILPNMDFCFPKSIGWKYLNEDLASRQKRMVYWPDSDEEAVNKVKEVFVR